MAKLAPAVLVTGLLGTAWCTVTLTLAPIAGHPPWALMVSGLAALGATVLAAVALEDARRHPPSQRGQPGQHRQPPAETRMERKIR